MPTSVCGLVDALAADRDRARRVGRQSRDHLENGGLAAAARADDGDELRLLDIEIDVAAGFDNCRSSVWYVFADVLQAGCRVRLIACQFQYQVSRDELPPRRDAAEAIRESALLLRRVWRLREILVGVVLARGPAAASAWRISPADPGSPASPPWPTRPAACPRCAWCAVIDIVPSISSSAISVLKAGAFFMKISAASSTCCRRCIPSRAASRAGSGELILVLRLP